jgi:hypothetical protein
MCPLFPSHTPPPIPQPRAVAAPCHALSIPQPRAAAAPFFLWSKSLPSYSLSPVSSASLDQQCQPRARTWTTTSGAVDGRGCGPVVLSTASAVATTGIRGCYMRRLALLQAAAPTAIHVAANDFGRCYKWCCQVRAVARDATSAMLPWSTQRCCYHGSTVLLPWEHGPATMGAR